MIMTNRRVAHDTEDKAWWVAHGESMEAPFVALCQQKLGIDAQINPAKSEDPTAPDLLVSGEVADLKVQNTPFFSAGRYGLDPRFAVTLNRTDVERYTTLYPRIVIYFWVDWLQLEWRDLAVAPLRGVWRANLAAVTAMIELGAPEHSYVRRRDDRRGNAKSSYLLDLQELELVALFEA